MKKVILFLSLLIIGILIFGCAEIEEDTTVIDDKDDGYDDVDFGDDFFPEVDGVEKISDDQTESGDCEAGWRCISSGKMVYQNSDCSFGEKKDCNTLCENNTCRPAKVCDVGFKCYNDEQFGYQKEDCSWIKKKLCEAGCEKGDCVDVDENATVEDDEIEPDESVPVVVYEQLDLNDEIILEEMPVSLYILESDRVKITIDGKNSNWLAEGESFTRNDLTINVEEILFQKYGTKAISYTVG